MRHPPPQPEVTRKLISRRGTLLGTVTIPASWAEAIDRDRLLRFYRPPARLLTYSAETVPETIAVGILALAHHIEYPAAVILHGLTPEEFETLPGCSFAPGAAYLRSLLGDG